MPLELPVAISIFKGDMFTPPKVWGERTYSKLFYWNEVSKGGHFAALEQPVLFLVCAPIFVYLLVPTLIVVPMAFTPGALLKFPPGGMSLRPFRALLGDPAWVDAAIQRGARKRPTGEVNSPGALPTRKGASLPLSARAEDRPRAALSQSR